MVSSPACFLILLADGVRGRKSETAAAMISTSASSTATVTACCMAMADSTSMTGPPQGSRSTAGVAISVTSAPASTAAKASARPIVPLERFPMYRTGSSASRVPPADTTTRRPLSWPARPRTDRTANRMLAREPRRPSPWAPDARYPRSGSTIVAPSCRSVSTFLRVAGWCHIWCSIAGAITSGASVASATAPIMFSTIPLARWAMAFAVAGATSTTSASRAIETCPVSPASHPSNTPV